MNTRLLLVEDEDAHAELIFRAFERCGEAWLLERARSLAEAWRFLASGGYDLILADYRLPDGEGLELLGAADNPGDPERPVVLMTSHGSEYVAVDAIKRGALDYVVKSPESFISMPSQISKAMRSWALMEEKRRAEASLRKSLLEKEILLKEVHHRVKNNFQVVSSLLSLQAESLHEEAAKRALMESENRIKSMALIHEKLYESEDYSRIDFADYLMTLGARLDMIYRASERGIMLSHEIDQAELSLETAIPLGLVLNELITNSLSHAFPEEGLSPAKTGRIFVSLKKDADTIQIAVHDNGRGLPAGLDFERPSSLGLQLVRLLSSQAGARLRLETGAGGTTITLTLMQSGS